MADIFISYSSKDAGTADRLYAFLSQNDIQCWLDNRNLQGGSSFASSIVNAIRQCKILILLASKNSNVSPHVCNEVSIAFDNKKVIIPFRIEAFDFSDDLLYYIGRMHWIDAYGKFDVALNELLNQVKPLLSVGGHRQTDINLFTTEELLQHGLSYLEIAKNLVSNDRSLYPEISDENEGTPEQWAEYIKKYPLNWMYLYSEAIHKIIGNWSILSLQRVNVSKEKGYEEGSLLDRVLKGEITEDAFNIFTTTFPFLRGHYHGYILNFSLNAGYQHADLYEFLFHSFFSRLNVFQAHGIYFDTWTVNIFTDEQCPIYEALGFEYVCANKNSGKIYHVDLNSSSEGACTFKEMMKEYCDAPE